MACLGKKIFFIQIKNTIASCIDHSGKSYGHLDYDYSYNSLIITYKFSTTFEIQRIRLDNLNYDASGYFYFFEDTREVITGLPLNVVKNAFETSFEDPLEMFKDDSTKFVFAKTKSDNLNYVIGIEGAEYI